MRFVILCVVFFSVDVIFSVGLLTLLSDDQVQELLSCMLSWLYIGGTLIIRETCFEHPGILKMYYVCIGLFFNK